MREVNISAEVGELIELEQESVLARSDALPLATATEETTIIERRVTFANEEVDVDVETAQQRVENPLFRFHHSSSYSKDDRGVQDAKSYAHLFPFGRGHTSEKRRVPVSRRECLKYYSLLSSRRFAQDQTFILTAFDRLALDTAYMRTAVTCKRHPGIYRGFETVTRSELSEALLANELRKRGKVPISQQTASQQTSNRFLRTVQISASAVWGSNSERQRCRNEAFGYQAKFGQPALFVTLSPDTDNSLVMAYYAGEYDVRTLLDTNFKGLPSRVQMRKIAMKDDVAAARLYDRQILTFIETVLRFDIQKRMPKKEGGLFGHTKAYYGMTETQGRGTLHAHFLIWIYGVPQNSTAYENVVRNQNRGPSFRQALLEYTDSIVTTNLPVSSSTFDCTACRETAIGIEPLPLPLASLKNPRTRNRCNNSEYPKEPLLLRCSACQTGCSSQHVLRQALVRERPLQWPPPLRALSPVELRKWIAYESQALQISIEDASARVSAREHYRQIYHDYLNFLTEHPNEDTYMSSPAFMRILEDMAVRQLQIQNTAEEDALRHDLVSRMIAMTPPSLDDERLSLRHHQFLLSTLVILLNMHSWAHTNSCFKQSRAASSKTICRYKFPRPRVPATAFKGSAIVLERKPGHEYINGYNATILQTFKCNHDVQVLVGGHDATDRIYYTFKYVTKEQKQTDCSVALALAAFDRRLQREADNSSPDRVSATDRARRRVNSMVYTTTNKHEVAGPLAALYILRGHCHYSSHPCQTLNLRHVLAQISGDDEYACDLIPVDNSNEEATGYRTVSHLDDYVYRPEIFGSMSLYEFVSKCFRKKTTSESCNTLCYLSDHPLARSHSIGVHHKSVVPVITGPKLPLLSDRADTSARNLHAKIVLALFKPFRTVSDLLGTREGPDAWPKAFDDWYPATSQSIKTTVENMYDHHIGKTLAQGRCFNDVTDYVVNDDEENYDIDGFPSDGSDGEPHDTNSSVEYVTGSTAIQDDDVDPAWVTHLMESNTLDPRRYPTQAPVSNTGNLWQQHCSAYRLLQPAVLRTLEYSQNYLAQTLANGGHDIRQTGGDHNTTNALREWVVDTSTDDSHSHTNEVIQGTGHLPDELAPARMEELVQDALLPHNLSWNQQQQQVLEQPSTNNFASINTISQWFTLNKLQHLAFSIVGIQLLRKWGSIFHFHGIASATQLIQQVDSDTVNNQLRMFLGGEGGTGKSRVIDAIEALCHSWKRPHSILKTALTGKAATLIGGNTFASFAVFLKFARSTSLIQQLDLLLIDEVSMMSKTQLLQLDKLLRRAKRVPDVAFGGVDVILVGDFLQMPPVRAKPLYTPPDPSPATRPQEVEAYELYRTFDTVIVLRENMRFREDPEWGRECALARRGEWTDNFIDIINTRCLQLQPCPTQREQQPSHSTPTQIPPSLSHDVKFVTPDNSTRLLINNYFVYETAQALPPGTYPIRVVANFKGALRHLNLQEVQQVMGLPDTSFGRMAPYLDLIPGMPVQVTQNVRPKKGVANGTAAVLHSVRFPLNTQFRLVRDSSTGMIVSFPSHRPLYAMLQVKRGPGAQTCPFTTDNQLFPVFPTCEPFAYTEIQLATGAHGRQRKLKIKIQQFPFVPAAGSTVYKVQGDTLKSLVIVDWKATGKRACNRPEQSYLMLSRVVSRNALLILKPFTRALANWSRPARAALAEEDRLVQQSNATCDNLQSRFPFLF